jgi:hypothetical protein
MSSPPVIECVTLPLGPELKKDHSVLAPIMETLVQQKGCKKVSYGKVIEDENTGLIFVGTPSHTIHTDRGTVTTFPPLQNGTRSTITSHS